MNPQHGHDVLLSTQGAWIQLKMLRLAARENHKGFKQRGCGLGVTMVCLAAMREP